jgi:hypothetical protein
MAWDMCVCVRGGGMSQGCSGCNNVENKLCGTPRQKWEAFYRNGYYVDRMGKVFSGLI